MDESGRLTHKPTSIGKGLLHGCQMWVKVLNNGGAIGERVNVSGDTTVLSLWEVRGAGRERWGPKAFVPGLRWYVDGQD